MRIADLIRYALRGASVHRLRTALTMLGVAVGATAVVTLTALGEGARLYVVNRFATLGSNLLIVLPGKTETTGSIPGMGGVPNDLTLDDARAIERGMREVQAVVPICVGTEGVSAGERSRQVPVVGTTNEFRGVRQLGMLSGRFLPTGDLRRGSPVCVLGVKLARELFGHREATGRIVRIGGWRMRVLGVMSSRGVQIGLDIDDLVIVPVQTAMRIFNRRSLFRLLLETRPGADLERMKQRALDLLTERHGEEDVTVFTQEAVVDTLGSILGALTLGVFGIAIISLAVAGVGIMNVMLVAVSERTREVGLLAAIGAGRRQILAVFVVEAILLSSAGGAAGLAAGWGLVGLIRGLVPGFPATVPLWAIIAVGALSVGAGAVFGAWPAAKAARLDPIVALQGRG